MANARSKTIGEMQAEFEAAFARLASAKLPSELEALRVLIPPRGMAARVSLRNAETHRQFRRTADGSSWNPLTSEAAIHYEFDEESDATASHDAASVRASAAPVSDLLLALDAAERDARF